MQQRTEAIRREYAIGVERLAALNRRRTDQERQRSELIGRRSCSALRHPLLNVNPSPFCILDEADAALDESNVGRFRDALRQLSPQNQLILITHNRGTIEVTDMLYGVSMGDDGAPCIISLCLEEYVRSETTGGQ